MAILFSPVMMRLSFDNRVKASFSVRMKVWKPDLLTDVE